MIDTNNISNIDKKLAKICVESVLIWADGKLICNLDLERSYSAIDPDNIEMIRQVMAMAAEKQSGASDSAIYSDANLQLFRNPETWHGLYGTLVLDVGRVITHALKWPARQTREIDRNLTNTFWCYKHNCQEKWGHSS